MKLFIPPLGTELTLTKDWTFSVINEYRNDALLTWLGLESLTYTGGGYGRRLPLEKTATLPAGTVLKVDRIYIRRGAKAFDSVTFTVPKKSVKQSPPRPFRFFAHLDDVNTMEVL